MHKTALVKIHAMLVGEEVTITRGKTSITIGPEHVEAEIRARVLRDVIKILQEPVLCQASTRPSCAR